VVSEASAVAAHSGVPISVTNLTGEAAAAQRTSLVGAGALVVATPGRLATALREGWLTPAGLQGLTMVVLDEADLLLSYGYEEELQALAPMVGGAARVCVCVCGVCQCGAVHGTAPSGLPVWVAPALFSQLRSRRVTGVTPVSPLFWSVPVICLRP
jgi:hypothetical protein